MQVALPTSTVVHAGSQPGGDTARSPQELDLTAAYEQVATPEAADNLGFSGSPTILIDSRGPFACGGEPVGRSCHVNQTSGRSAGVLTVEQLRAVVAR